MNWVILGLRETVICPHRHVEHNSTELPGHPAHRFIWARAPVCLSLSKSEKLSSYSSKMSAKRTQGHTSYVVAFSVVLSLVILIDVEFDDWFTNGIFLWFVFGDHLWLVLSRLFITVWWLVWQNPDVNTYEWLITERRSGIFQLQSVHTFAVLSLVFPISFICFSVWDFL